MDSLLLKALASSQVKIPFNDSSSLGSSKCSILSNIMESFVRQENCPCSPRIFDMYLGKIKWGYEGKDALEIIENGKYWRITPIIITF